MGDALITAGELVGAWPDAASLSSDERARLIRLATRSCEAHVGRALGLSDVVESFRPENARRIYLRVTPVVSVASVTVGAPGATTTLTADVGYSIEDPDTGELALYAGYSAGFRWPDRTYGPDPRTGRVVVAYWGGWATADVPDDIKQAAILSIRDAAARTTVKNGGIFQSESIGPYAYKVSNTFTETSTQMPVASAAIGYLKAYRRVRAS